MSPRVVLVGLPGSGKSTSGRRLARMLAVPFADSDDLVEAGAGRPVVTIFAESGEAAFRALEADAIAAALADFDGVLALGGGAVTTAHTRAALADGAIPVVVLSASVQTLTERVGDGHTRPLLAADARQRLNTLAAERGPVYEELATFTVDTDTRTPGQVASVIAARLHKLGAPS